MFLNAIQLEVTTPDSPAFAVQPAAIDVFAGDNAIFAPQVSGAAPLTFQWRKNGAAVAGATNVSLVLTNAQLASAATYTLVVTNIAGSVTSAPVILTVTSVTSLGSGLISHWPLDEATATTPDVTTNVNDLVLVNLSGANIAPGRRGNAMTFNGTSSLLTHDDGTGAGLPAYNFPAYSVALWVKGNGVGQSDRRVFSQASTTNRNPIASIGTDNSGTTGVVDIFLRNDSFVTSLNHRKSSLIAFDGSWHHVAWVDNNGTCALYVDGVRDANNFNYTRIGPVSLNRTAVGGLLRDIAGSWFAGSIDDVVVYRRALSGPEVQAVMSGGPDGAIYWTGLGDGTNWHNAQNWSEGFVPQSTNKVVVATKVFSRFFTSPSRVKITTQVWTSA